MKDRMMSTLVFTGLLGLSVATVIQTMAAEQAAPSLRTVEASKKIPAVSKKMPMVVHPDIPLTGELQRYARAQAYNNNVPYVLVLAVMEQESRFDATADSGDSYGLMQVHKIHGPRHIIIEPRENIRIGCWLLGHYWQQYHDWNKALTAYNCGAQGAEESYFRHGSISSPYSRQVMLRSERFARMLGEESALMPK